MSVVQTRNKTSRYDCDDRCSTLFTGVCSSAARFVGRPTQACNNIELDPYTADLQSQNLEPAAALTDTFVRLTTERQLLWLTRSDVVSHTERPSDTGPCHICQKQHRKRPTTMLYSAATITRWHSCFGKLRAVCSAPEGSYSGPKSHRVSLFESVCELTSINLAGWQGLWLPSALNRL